MNSFNMSVISREKPGVLRALILCVIFFVNKAQGIPLRASPEHGNVEIFHNNEWKRLLTSSVDVPGTKVLCRSLGLPSDDVSHVLHELPSTSSIAKISIRLACIGNETNIDDCHSEFSTPAGVSDRLITLTCKALSFDLYGGSPTDGLVMVTKGNASYPVCIDPIVDGKVAELMCKSMGFNNFYPLVMYPYKYTENKELTLALKLELTCTGNGSNCELHTTNTDEFCSRRYGISYTTVAAVFCSDQAPEYRLTKPQGEKIGRVDVKINGTWGPVCDIAGNPRLAQTLCSAEGSASTGARFFKGLYRGNSNHGSAGFHYCVSDSDDSDYCEYSLVGEPCRGESYLALECSNATEGEVRLSGRSPWEGLVQVYHQGQWRIVGVNSSKLATQQDATVACRSVKMATNTARVINNKFLQNVSLLLNDIECEGTEARLLDCSRTPLDEVDNTTRGRLLEVSCDSNEGALQLNDDGLLLMQRNGHWGTFCASAVGSLDAAVICRSLGKPSTLATVSSRSSNRTGLIWPYQFACQTKEDKWRSCLDDTRKIETYDCTHGEDAYITCGDLDRSSIRYKLINSPIPSAGYVQMQVNNMWGAVCARGFSEKEAEVICRSLNMRTDGAKKTSTSLLRQLESSKVWLDRVNCTGTEASLFDCDHAYIGGDDCKSWYGRAAVSCGAPIADDFSVRLVGGSDSKRVEVSMFGEWGTICDVNFDESDARTVCRQLDLPYFQAEVAKKGTYESGTGRIWLTNISCKGYEDRLKRCTNTLAGGTCDHSQDVGIVCKGYTPYSPRQDFFSDGVPLGVILGASFGSAALLIFAGVLLIVLARFCKKGQAVGGQSVAYYTPTSNENPQVNNYPPPPYEGYTPQYAPPNMKT